jgi:hypothetical protein
VGIAAGRKTDKHAGMFRGRLEGKVLVIEAGIEAYWRRIHRVRLEQRQAGRQSISHRGGH